MTAFAAVRHDVRHGVRLFRREPGLALIAITNGTYSAWQDAAAIVESLGGWMAASQTLRGAGEQAALMIGIGVAAGLSVTLIAAESLSKVLYSIAARDSVSFTTAPLAIAPVGGVACIVPSRRAARVDPLRALRSR